MKAVATPSNELYCSACEHMFPTSTGEVCPRDGTRLIRLVGQKDPYLGRDLDGRYVILEKMGQGGMGAVYRGNQRSVDREVAIKVLNTHVMAEPEMIKRFLREARLASRINHPNAVAVLDFGQTEDGVFYLVMELVAGKTLGEILDAETTIAPQRAAEIGAQICLALEGAHAVPIVHRDLKPANVIVDPNGFVKVLDFGIAKSLSPDTISSTMTNVGAIMGTPAFMPPEVGLGNPCDERSDLYSLGCVLYTMVSGDVPFEADALPAIMMKHAVERPPPLVGVPRDLDAVIMKLLAKNPSSRYQSATEARLALEATIHDGRSTPRPWSELSPASRAASKPLHEADTVRPSRYALDDVEAPTVPLLATAARGVPPRSERRAWPWIAAAGVIATISIGWFAIDPLGGEKSGSAPSSPAIEAQPTEKGSEHSNPDPPTVAPRGATADSPQAPPAVAPTGARVDPIVAPSAPVDPPAPTVAPTGAPVDPSPPTMAEPDEIAMPPDPLPPSPSKPTPKPSRPAGKLTKTKPATPVVEPPTKPVKSIKPVKPVEPPDEDPPPPF